jgi:hypothetical protein
MGTSSGVIFTTRTCMPMIAGVDNLNARYGGIHNFCIGHRAYHMIGLDRVPEGMRPTFLQLYIHDQDELNDRMAMKVAERLDRDVMQALQQELHLVNPFIRRFKAINPGDLQPHMDIEIRADISKYLMHVNDLNVSFCCIVMVHEYANINTYTHCDL